MATLNFIPGMRITLSPGASSDTLVFPDAAALARPDLLPQLQAAASWATADIYATASLAVQVSAPSDPGRFVWNPGRGLWTAFKNNIGGFAVNNNRLLELDGVDWFAAPNIATFRWILQWSN